MLQHITYVALISVAQPCDNECISTFTNKNIIIYDKQEEPQMKVPQDSSTGLWKLILIKNKSTLK